MPMIADSFSSHPRPMLKGVLGAVSAADPLAVAAGTEILAAGGSAVDAAIAAQAVLCVVLPNACGLGGDALVMVREEGHEMVAVNGTGAAPVGLVTASNDGANSVTIPGLVHAWGEMHSRWGVLPLSKLLDPAIRIARLGFPVPARLARSVQNQMPRLLRGGAKEWALLKLKAGERFVQPEVADLLEAIGREGTRAYYAGRHAEALAAALQALGGAHALVDLTEHKSVVRAPVSVDWRGNRVAVQPPVTQGVILAMALAGLEKLGDVPADLLDHAEIELTDSAFAYRDRCDEGEALLAHDLPVDLTKASRRGGPRAYLHTAGVATSDANGMVVSSLVSLFDDFGSAVFAPAGGFILNNRAAGFTEAPNEAAPGKKPIHTLAPALVESGSDAIAMSTPGADGQVQTLLQIFGHTFVEGADLASAIDAPRWRSEGGKVLIEESHSAREKLAALGHDIVVLPDGEIRFGGIVCAGFIDGVPVAGTDWRRQNWAGVV